jgi:hypothetical protein
MQEPGDEIDEEPYEIPHQSAIDPNPGNDESGRIFR